MSNPWSKFLSGLVGVLVITLMGGSIVHADPHERHGHFHHDHHYPRIGYTVSVLPAGAVVVNYHGGPFYYHAGVWYRPSGPGFIVVTPPVGVIVPVLPPAYTTVYAGGVPYYYANDIYYQQVPGGYAVASQPPTYVQKPESPMPQAPQGAPPPAPDAPAQAPGMWYYCDSAKAYYPYVGECKEGWRAVPAAPPTTR